MSEQLLRRVADSLIDLPYRTWDFGDSIAFEGMVAASRRLDDDRYLTFVHGWLRAWATRAEPFRRSDCTAPGSTMVAVAEHTGDARVLERATRLANYLLSRPRMPSGLFATWEHSPLQHPYGPVGLSPRGSALLADPPPGAFVDCLHFDPPFLARLGALTGERRFLDAGVEQALAYIARLQDERTGVFDHFELQGEPGTFGRGWGRGQGWALLGLLEVLEVLSRPGANADHAEHRSDLASSVVRLVGAMLELQLESGHWATDIRSAATGVEPSTAAFMATGFRRAVHQDLLPSGLAKRALDGAARAHAAVVADLTPDGALPVSAAVMACTTDSHYAHVPTGFTVPWGQGPVATMLAEAPW